MEGLNTMSPPASPYGTAQHGHAVGVGADLRMARERLGWDLSFLSSRLRIRLPYLEAIEEGRLADLPGNAYAVGFLRTYAAAVGLDADEISRRFRAEMAELGRKTELTFPAPVPERGVPALAVVLVGLLLVIGGYIGWYRVTGMNDAAPVETATLPDHLAPVEAGLTPMPKPVEMPQAALPQGAFPQSASASIPPNASATVAGTTPAMVVPSIPVPVLVPVTMPGATPADPAAASGAQAANAAPVAPLASDGGRLVIRAKAEAWLQVRDRSSNSVVLDRTMKAGDAWPVPNRSGLLLTVGNAGGTEILLDGKPTAPLGADGAVRRNLPLDLDQVQAGKLAATYQAAPGAPVAQPSQGPQPAPAAQARPASSN